MSLVFDYFFLSKRELATFLPTHTHDILFYFFYHYQFLSKFIFKQFRFSRAMAVRVVGYRRTQMRIYAKQQIKTVFVLFDCSTYMPKIHYFSYCTPSILDRYFCFYMFSFLIFFLCWLTICRCCYIFVILPTINWGSAVVCTVFFSLFFTSIDCVSLMYVSSTETAFKIHFAND